MFNENVFGSNKTGGLFDQINYVDVIVKNTKTGEIEQTQRSNLITYHGRSYLAQRVFNQPTIQTWPNRYVNLFCVGSGGAPVGSLLTQSPPQNQDLNLYKFVNIASGNPQIVKNEITTPDGLQEVEFLKFDSATFQADPNIDPASSTADNPSFVNSLDPVYQDGIRRDAFTDVMVQTTLLESDALGQHINEAGLYVCEDPDNMSPLANSASLFARVTFSSILKTENREILFKWLVKF